MDRYTRARRTRTAQNRDSSGSRRRNSRSRRREPNNRTTLGKARLIWNNLQGIIERIGSKFLVWFLVLFCAGVMFSFLESATAASGGLFHGLNAVLKNASKGLGLICLFLGIYAWLRGALRSFRTYREIRTPEKKFFQKIHQFKYELLDGVVDAPSQSDDEDDEDEDEDEPESAPTPRQRRQPQRHS